MPVINQTRYERLREYFIETLMPANVAYTMLIINRQLCYEMTMIIEHPLLSLFLFFVTIGFHRLNLSKFFCSLYS